MAKKQKRVRSAPVLTMRRIVTETPEVVAIASRLMDEMTRALESLRLAAEDGQRVLYVMREMYEADRRREAQQQKGQTEIPLAVPGGGIAQVVSMEQ